VTITRPLLLSTCPNVNTPAGQLWTQAEQRTHSGSAIGKPVFAKFMITIRRRQTEAQTLQEMENHPFARKKFSCAPPSGSATEILLT